MNKQIEEIARTCPYNVQGRCVLDETICTTDCEVAKWGYEKASDVAREIFSEVDKLIYRLLNDVHYIAGDLVWDINELKKKYEKEG